MMQGTCQGVRLEIIDTPGLRAAAGDAATNAQVLQQIRRCVCVCAVFECVCWSACACVCWAELWLGPLVGQVWACECLCC